MVLDSTICNLNPRCTLPERMQMPTVCDVQLTYAPQDPPGFWHGLSLDFKAAHKACVVREDERGTLLFRHKDKLYFYKVCHFGARFSSYWWQRLGSVLHRIMHHLISHRPHRSFLYVDDIFAMLAAQHSTELTCLIICFLAAVNAPISWKKAQIGHCITWCGWSFDLLTDTATRADQNLQTPGAACSAAPHPESASQGPGGHARPSYMGNHHVASAPPVSCTVIQRPAQCQGHPAQHTSIAMDAFLPIARRSGVRAAHSRHVAAKTSQTPGSWQHQD